MITSSTKERKKINGNIAAGEAAFIYYNTDRPTQGKKDKEELFLWLQAGCFFAVINCSNIIYLLFYT